MKYSIKNKEFSRKKHNIFDKNTHKSRSRSSSLTPKKSIQNSNDNIEKQYLISVKPPNLNHSAIDKLNSTYSNGNSLHIQKNQEQFSVFQSFAKVQNPSYNSHKSIVTTNNHSIKPSQPLKFVLPQTLNIKTNSKIPIENSQPKSQSFQICEGQNHSRINRFFQESILAKQSQSPQMKIVFQPVIRKSLSPDPKSLSPDPTQKQAFNKVNSINLRILPQQKIMYPHTEISRQNYQFQRRIDIIQIPRQMNKIQNKKTQLSPANSSSNEQNNLILHNKIQDQQIFYLRKKIQDQNLQIQYLKNQKQILESNIQLQFSSKNMSSYQSAEETHKKTTPQKYGVQSPSINQQIDRNKLIQLTQILKANQIKLSYMESKYYSFYSLMFNRFNESLVKCQELLIKLFSQKYFSFSEQLDAKLYLIEKKTNLVANMDHKIDIFTNTFRSIEETLRITKLKQQNIQLQIQNRYRKSDRFWNKQEGSRLTLMENQSDISSIRKYDDNQLQEKDRQELKKLQRNIRQNKNSRQINSNEVQDDAKEFDSFLEDKYSHLVYKRKIQTSNKKAREDYSNQKNKNRNNLRKRQNSHSKGKLKISQLYQCSQKIKQNKSKNGEIQQFSPFQANQMFKNQKYSKQNNDNIMRYSQVVSNKQRTNENNQKQSFSYKYNHDQANRSYDNMSSKNYEFSQNSFQIQMEFKQQKPKDNYNKQISFTSQNIFKKQSNSSIKQNQDISDTLQGQQQRLVNILKYKNYQFPIDCWLDELGCLRKKNQTYIFDQQGSVIMTTAAAFKKLKEKKILL